MAPKSQCAHTVLQLETSPFAELAGFSRANLLERLGAQVHPKHLPPKLLPHPNENVRDSRTFPAPLVLPHDDLNYDPDCEAQSFRDWLDLEPRNKVTEKRKTIYVASVPAIDGKVEFMKDWLRPNIGGGDKAGERDDGSRKRKRTLDEEQKGDIRFGEKDVTEVFEYLEAFYHGMEIKEFPIKLRWTPWKGGATKPRGVPKHVALQYGEEATRIRARPAPDGAFPAQLNLNDILDAAIAMLPEDAYSIVLLVEHDIYEDVEDNYCCGRAYGGSRICVVQSARYNPLLDQSGKIDYAHLWPMSHCKDFVDELCAAEDVEPRPATTKEKRLSKVGPMRAAVDAAASLKIPQLPKEYQALWISRVARTVSHELGHCMGMGHCVYYACNMQGTAGMEEDGRQPPYLCPVCLMKLSYGVGVEREDANGIADMALRAKYVQERYRALREFCEKRQNVATWRGLEAWIDHVLKGMDA